MVSAIRCSYQLGDIMVKIPGLLEDSDLAKAETLLPLKQRRIDIGALKARIIHTLRELFLWRWWWEQENPLCAYRVPGNRLGSFSVDESGVPLFQSLIYFNHFHRGREPILYNASLLHVLQLAEIWSIEDAQARALTTLAHLDQPDHTNAMLLPHERLSKEEVVQEILTSLEFFLQGEQRNSGALTMMLPLRMTLPFVNEHKLQSWLRRITSSIAVFGFRFSQRLQNMEPIATDFNKSGSSPS